MNSRAVKERPSSVRRAVFAVVLLVLPSCAGADKNLAGTMASARTGMGAASRANAAQVHEERVRLLCPAAKDLASAIEKLVREDPEIAGGRIQSVVLDHRTSELVVVGTGAGIANATRFTARACDPPPADSKGVEVIPLIHAAASDVVHAVGPAAASDVRVIADVPTNSIVLEGTPEQRAWLRRAIVTLDVP